MKSEKFGTRHIASRTINISLYGLEARKAYLALVPAVERQQALKELLSKPVIRAIYDGLSHYADYMNW